MTMSKELAQKTIEAAILWTHVEPDRLHEAYSVMAGTSDLQAEIANLKAKQAILTGAINRQDRILEEIVTTLEKLAARVKYLEENAVIRLPEEDTRKLRFGRGPSAYNAYSKPEWKVFAGKDGNPMAIPPDKEKE